MTRDQLLAFLQRHRLGVQATVSPHGAPQAAVVGTVVTDRFEVVFDTLDTTRKVPNLRANPRVSVVIGWDEECTVQIDGLADEPKGADLARLKAAYFVGHPDGRERQIWPGITYVRVRPTWIRVSDFRKRPPEISVFGEAELLEVGQVRLLPSTAG